MVASHRIAAAAAAAAAAWATVGAAAGAVKRPCRGALLRCLTARYRRSAQSCASAMSEKGNDRQHARQKRQSAQRIATP
jgi:hypothetical protein